MKTKIIKISEILVLLGNEINLKLLVLLKLHDELCVCQLQDFLGLPQPTISRHLNSLYKLEFLTLRKEGRWRYYGLKELPDFIYKILEIAKEEYKINENKKPLMCKP